MPRALAVVALAALAVPAAAHGAEPPWPTMRHDARNTGRSPAAPVLEAGDRPWTVRTGKGVFSTPVVGGDGTVYVGSADARMYAIGRRGRVRWRLRTDGIIDAAGAVTGAGSAERLTFGGGDEVLRQVDPRGRRPRTIWSYRPSRRPATGQLVNWWEGNVAVGPGGGFYVGNTGGGAYALTPEGRERWVHQAGNSVWTTPAFAPDGTSYWGSLDLTSFALAPDGAVRWQQPTLGYVVASAAVGSDGTVYTASFDGALRALDPATGAVRWSFQTADNVYASPALLAAADGTTTGVVLASTDGSVYRVGVDGRQVWRFDTGDVVRSSPVLAPRPGGGGDLVHVGGGDGRLWVLDADTGRARWSFDTTPRAPALRDRNDLNGSPALTRTGVVIGGEHGRVSYVPFDWCLRTRRDARCDRAPAQPHGTRDQARVLGVSAGGATGSDLGTVPSATTLAARVLVRRGGQALDAGVRLPAGAVRVSPPFPFRARTSGDGRNIVIVPRGLLRPATRYTVRVRAPWAATAPRVGPLPADAPTEGTATGVLRFRTAPRAAGDPWRIGTAFELRRLAFPLPPFLTSVNQIGFDSYDWVMGVVARGRGGRLTFFVIGTRPGPRGTRVADPGAGFAFGMTGRARGRALLLSRRDLVLRLSFGDVPARRFDLRMQLDRRWHALPGSTVSGDVVCGDVPTYAAALRFVGLCNADDVLPLNGTFLTDRYSGDANRRPPGVRVTGIRLRGASVTARLRVAPGARYRAARHVVSILLTDARTGDVVPVDLPRATTVRTTDRGDVASVRVQLPARTRLPRRVRAIVVGDVAPLAEAVLDTRRR